MTKREFLDTVFALAPNEANKIMDAFDEYVESAQLSTNLASLGMDCISRQAAIDRILATGYADQIKNNLLLILRLLPPAQPEIVRCKDCKHWIPYDWMFSEVWQSKNMTDYPEDETGCNLCDMAMKANDFCSRAERREVTT